MKLKYPCSLEGKAMTNLHSILKGRDITLPTKIWTVKAMIFPVVMYGCKSWIIKEGPGSILQLDSVPGLFSDLTLPCCWTQERGNKSGNFVSCPPTPVFLQLPWWSWAFGKLGSWKSALLPACSAWSPASSLCQIVTSSASAPSSPVDDGKKARTWLNGAKGTSGFPF